MSNFLAIAAATATLRQIIEDAIKPDVSGSDVTTLRPNSPANELPSPGANLYLFQVTPNAAWRNNDLPTRRGSGDLVQRPRIALDLHYLISFYGDEKNLEPQRVLGSTVRAIHEQPVISRQKIRSVIKAAVAADPNHFLAKADLDGEPELVKLTPLALTLEELSKLWSVFFQTAYTLSVAYMGTLVLIESSVSPEPALPVRQRGVYGITLRQPTIEKVEAAPGPDLPIFSGGAIALLGEMLASTPTQVRFGDTLVTVEPADARPTRVEVNLPAGLRAGVQGVQIEQPVLMGEPLTAHAGVESNIAPFVLRPQIGAPSVGAITSTVKDGITYDKAPVTVTFTPKVAQGQRVSLLLNEFQTTPSPTARAYRFNAPPWSEISLPLGITDTDTLTFAVSGVIPGQYLVRVQVDGAESVLELDSAGEKYVNPVITL
jgi:hypothetical protein